MFSLKLQPNEKLIKIYRQTPLVLSKFFLIYFLAIFIPWFFLHKYELDAKFSKILYLWTTLFLILAMRKYLLWMLNSYLLTNARLIEFLYFGILHKKVLETPLERILNISFETKGFFPSILNFGDVFVQIIGLSEPLILKKVKNPAQVKDFLWKIHTQTALKKPESISFQKLAQVQQKENPEVKKPKIV